MRILHVLDHSLPLHSGYSFRTAAILRAQRERGWQTMHLTTPRHGLAAPEKAALAAETAGGLEFLRTRQTSSVWARLPAVGPYVAEMRATADRLMRCVEEWQPDVLHAHSPVLTALPALWVGRKRGLPVVYELRALWEEGAVDHGTTHEGSLRYRLSRALETFVLRRADHVTTICEGLRNEVAARGVATDCITVIPNAVDTQAFAFDAPPDEALRAELGLVGKTAIGFIGSFYGYEGLEHLVEAFAQLARPRPELTLLFAGGGPREQGLKDACRRLGVEDRVRFLGRVPHDQVKNIYGLIDLLVYPRLPMRLTDLVTPLKPLEAMALGCMLIASDVGGHRELIRDGQTGFLFPAGDVAALARCIDKALAARQQWPAMRAAGRRFVERERTWTNSVARYDGVYHELARGNRSSVPRTV